MKWIGFGIVLLLSISAISSSIRGLFSVVVVVKFNLAIIIQCSGDSVEFCTTKFERTFSCSIVSLELLNFMWHSLCIEELHSSTRAWYYRDFIIVINMLDYIITSYNMWRNTRAVAHLVFQDHPE